jgi:hypothetical protein
MFRHSPEPRRLDVQVLTTERLSRRSATSFSATQRSVQLPTLFSDVSTFRYRVRSTPRLTFSCGVATETSRPSATAYRFGASVVQRRRVLPATRSFSCVVSLGDGDRSATAYCPASRGCSATTGVHSDLSVQRPTLPGATSMFSDWTRDSASRRAVYQTLDVLPRDVSTFSYGIQENRRWMCGLNAEIREGADHIQPRRFPSKCRRWGTYTV